MIKVQLNQKKKRQLCTLKTCEAKMNELNYMKKSTFLSNSAEQKLASVQTT